MSLYRQWPVAGHNRTDTQELYVDEPGIRVTREGDRVVVEYREKFHRFRLNLPVDEAQVLLRGLIECVPMPRREEEV